ncbi:MAG: AAA family ATPase [Oscillospiraceae bacterium]|nr:AAA family ATPase [Oscillospiraceae bacterium]
MSYELNQADIFGLTRQLAPDFHQKGMELFYRFCPYCNGGDHRDRDTFSVNLETGAYKCFRSSCGAQGHFVEMARDFNYRLEGVGEPPKKQYRRFRERREIVVRDRAIEYMKSRGISEEVTRRYQLTIKKGTDNILVFPFFDNKGELKFIKYRKTDFNKSRDKNKEWCEKDTEPILFGMMQCSQDSDTLIITEGQLDSLSVAQAGIPNAVSVPTGANGFTWLDGCYDWILNSFKRVIVFGDYERGKMSLLDTLMMRLPLPVSHVRYEDYLGEKDANDILRKFGENAIRKAIENAVPCVVPHIKKLSEVAAVDLNSLPKILTCIDGLDSVIGGMFFGQVVLLTGKRGEGKSTLMSQLCAEALDQNYGIFAYSGELPDYHFKSWLDMQLAGAANISTMRDRYGNEVYTLAPGAAQTINDWYDDKAYIYDNNAVSDDELSDVIKAAEMAIRRYGVKLICIDNLMMAMDVSMNEDLYRAQGEFVRRLKELAQKYDIVAVLVAHPKKTSGEFTNDAVSGSSDITNRVDVVINYQRAADDAGCDSFVTVTKNRLTGRLITENKPVRLYFSDKSKRIQEDTKTCRVYGCFKEQTAEDKRNGLEDIFDELYG